MFFFSLFLDLLKVFFFTLYHGKSPSDYNLWEYKLNHHQTTICENMFDCLFNPLKHIQVFGHLEEMMRERIKEQTVSVIPMQWIQRREVIWMMVIHLLFTYRTLIGPPKVCPRLQSFRIQPFHDPRFVGAVGYWNRLYPYLAHGFIDCF